MQQIIRTGFVKKNDDNMNSKMLKKIIRIIIVNIKITKNDNNKIQDILLLSSSYNKI